MDHWTKFHGSDEEVCCRGCPQPPEPRLHSRGFFTQTMDESLWTRSFTASLSGQEKSQLWMAAGHKTLSAKALLSRATTCLKSCLELICKSMMGRINQPGQSGHHSSSVGFFTQMQSWELPEFSDLFNATDSPTCRYTQDDRSWYHKDDFVWASVWTASSPEHLPRNIMKWSWKEIYKTSSGRGRKRRRRRIQRRMTSKGRNRMTATRITMRMRARIVARMRIKTRVGTTVRLETKTMKRMMIRIWMTVRIRVTRLVMRDWWWESGWREWSKFSGYNNKHRQLCEQANKHYLLNAERMKLKPAKQKWRRSWPSLKMILLVCRFLELIGHQLTCTDFHVLWSSILDPVSIFTGSGT